VVMDAHRRLIAELTKPAGRRVELGLEPGQYQVYFEQDKALLSTNLRLEQGQHEELSRESLQPETRMPTTRRGVEEPPPQPVDDLDGRWRILFQGGVTNTSVVTTPTVTTVGGALGGFQVSTWVRKDLALGLRFHAIDTGVVDTPTTSTTGSDLGFLLGARYH